MFGGGNKGSAEPTSNRAIAAALLSVVLALVALLAPVIALLGLFKPAEILVSEWFMRSGAITAVFAFSAQTVAASALDKLYPKGIGSLEHGRLAGLFAKPLKLISRFAFWLAITGSIIWGYGDLGLTNAHEAICGRRDLPSL